MRRLTPQEKRIERAKVLLSEGRISREQDGSFRVQSSLEQIWYSIQLNGDGSFHCTCPDHQFRGVKCKHIWAVELYEDSNNYKEVADMAKKQKQFQAEAEVVAVNENDLPRRLGLLLRNGRGEEKWFSMWKNDDQVLPGVEEGDRVKITYVQKPGKKGKDPFLNIIDLEFLEPGDGKEDPNERVREVLARDLQREVSIRAAVAVKAAAQWGWAQDMDDLLACANTIYDWLKAKEEAEVEEALGKEVSEEESGD